MNLTQEQKRALYICKRYKFRAPPVCTRQWDEEDWFQFIAASDDNWILPEGGLIKEPNNLRNRYRRKCAACRAYGWNLPTFREWANWNRYQNSESYRAGPIDIVQSFKELLNEVIK